MTRALWLKKILRRRSKGISSVLGTIFLLVIFFAISTNLFLWTISQNATYNQAVKDANQKNTDRQNERVIATQGNCTVYVSGVSVKIEAKLTNAGSLTAQIINLWVFDTSKQTYGFNNSIASMSESYLNPGEVMDLTDMKALIVSVTGAGSLDNFVAWFVTSRGNTVPITKAEGIIIAQVSQGIGSVGMNFESFVYYHVDFLGDKYLLRQSEWPGGLEGYSVPEGVSIAFRVELTNFDLAKRTINLSSSSSLWMIFPVTQQQVRSAWWYIVDVDGDGTIKSSFNQISLLYGQSTFVYFASKTDLGMSAFTQSSSEYDGPAAVNLMLFGKIGNFTFGQNIPFVSVYVTA